MCSGFNKRSLVLQQLSAACVLGFSLGRGVLVCLERSLLGGSLRRSELVVSLKKNYENCAGWLPKEKDFLIFSHPTYTYFTLLFFKNNVLALFCISTVFIGTNQS